MTIKWKKNNKLKPNVILEKIKSIRSVSAGGEVTFSCNGITTIEYHFSLSALETMIEFPKEMDGNVRQDLLRQVIHKPEELSEENIEKKLNELFKHHKAKPEIVFHVLGSVSLSQQQSGTFEIEGCIIEFLGGNFPEKYVVARSTAIEDTPFGTNEALNDYSKVIITVKEKLANRAFTKALRALDLQRAIWDLSSNQITVSHLGNEREPINKIRLGEIHTVHTAAGELASETFQYDPNFVKARPFNPWGQCQNFEENARNCLIQLNKSTYSEKLKDALLRYVRALDERDQNVALLKLWGAIESLTSPSGANGDLVTKRCAFLFSEFHYHQQVLEHLREYRNRSVHAGDQREEAKNNCFQLQYYFKQLIRFHLNKADAFSSLDKANEFLDLSPNKEELLRKKELIESALLFVG